MEKQITIWEWLEMLKEVGNEKLSRIISLENTFSTLEIVNFVKEQPFVMNDFTIWADRMEIEVISREFSDIQEVAFRLFNNDNYVMCTILSPYEFVRLQKFSDRAVEIIRGGL